MANSDSNTNFIVVNSASCYMDPLNYKMNHNVMFNNHIDKKLLFSNNDSWDNSCINITIYMELDSIEPSKTTDRIPTSEEVQKKRFENRELHGTIDIIPEKGLALIQESQKGFANVALDLINGKLEINLEYPNGESKSINNNYESFQKRIKNGIHILQSSYLLKCTMKRSSLKTYSFPMFSHPADSVNHSYNPYFMSLLLHNILSSSKVVQNYYNYNSYLFATNIAKMDNIDIESFPLNPLIHKKRQWQPKDSIWLIPKGNDDLVVKLKNQDNIIIRSRWHGNEIDSELYQELFDEYHRDSQKVTMFDLIDWD